MSEIKFYLPDFLASHDCTMREAHYQYLSECQIKGIQPNKPFCNILKHGF